MEIVLCLFLLALILLFALYRKGDVKAGVKTPVIEFLLDTKDKKDGDRN